MQDKDLDVDSVENINMRLKVDKSDYIYLYIYLGNSLYGSNDPTELMYSSDKYDNSISRDS